MCILLFYFNFNGIYNFPVYCATLQVAATADQMLAYVDFFLGGDEKRSDLPPRLQQRLPMSIIFGGDGSYMAPFSLQTDNILTSLMSQVYCLLVHEVVLFVKSSTELPFFSMVLCNELFPVNFSFSPFYSLFHQPYGID